MRSLRSLAFLWISSSRRRSSLRREVVSRSLAWAWSMSDCLDWSSERNEDSVSEIMVVIARKSVNDFRHLGNYGKSYRP